MQRGGDNHCKDCVCLGVGEHGNYNSTTLSTLQLFGLENILDLLIQKPICSWNGVPPLKASFLGLPMKPYQLLLVLSPIGSKFYFIFVIHILEIYVSIYIINICMYVCVIGKEESTNSESRLQWRYQEAFQRHLHVCMYVLFIMAYE